jgi:hypothetical protein
MEDEAKDVNQTDGQTDTTSSDGGETPGATDDTSSSESQEDNATATQDLKTVPYDRFAEVNEKFRNTELEKAQLQGRLEALEKMQQQLPKTEQPAVAPEVAAAKEQLKELLKEVAPELGYVSKEELRRRDAEASFKAEVVTLKEKYSGKDGRPAFDEKEALDYAVKNNLTLERAFKEMHETELINWQVQQAIAKSRGIQTENSNSTGSQQVGTTDQDLMTAAARGDREAQKIFAKRILQGSRK